MWTRTFLALSTTIVAATAQAADARVAATSSNNPLGFATKTFGVDTFGFITRPTWLPINFPGFPTKPVPSDLSTSSDAKWNPFASNSASHRGNWAYGYDINTDASEKWPNTGRTVTYKFNIVNTTGSPEGVPKPMLLINNQFPGPLIEANWGDWIQVEVTNSLAHNGTGLHWHGFLQKNTNTEDGVPGITECPIAPGQTRTYRFQATSYGSSWYHSHWSVQYGDGIVGPMVVHGPASANYDIDLGHVLITDAFPRTVFQQQWITNRVGPAFASNYYVNGKNTSPDGKTGSRTTFQFQKGKKHLLRLINAGSDNTFKIRLDGHKFLVIATDFVPVVPYYTNELSLTVGQRYDVVVTADQPVSNYYLRAMAATACSENLNDGTGIANPVVSYNGASAGLPAPVTNLTPINPNCFDEMSSALVPIVPKSVPSSEFLPGFQNLDVNVGRAQLVTGDLVFLWYINGVSENMDWSSPTIGQAVTGNTSFPPERHIVVLPKANVWTFWVLQNQFFAPHPMHLHGHEFAILGQGNGTFNANQHIGLLNFNAPSRRDVAMLIANGWTVVAFKTDNPGAWIMHCHITWHVAGGLSVVFLEQPDQIPKSLGAAVRGSTFQNTCASWKKYANGPVAYNKSDSGLRKRDDDQLFHVRKHLRSHKRGSAL